MAAREDITRIMTLECGKPLAESRNEFDSGYVIFHVDPKAMDVAVYDKKK